MGKIPKPDKRQRAHRRIGSTVASRGIYKLFVKPFIEAMHFNEEQSKFKEGIDAFFSVNDRPITWCKAIETFKLPGDMWATQSQPYKHIKGTGNRIVTKGAALILRQDLRNERHEIEFKDQSFVLTNAEFEVIKDKIKAIA